MLRLMNLIQVEGLAVLLDQVVSDDGSRVVLQRLEIPKQLERLLVLENFLSVLLLAVLEPLVLAATPIAVVPNFAHETAGFLEHALLLVPLHQLQRQANHAAVAQVLTRKLKLP